MIDNNKPIESIRVRLDIRLEDGSKREVWTEELAPPSKDFTSDEHFGYGSDDTSYKFGLSLRLPRLDKGDAFLYHEKHVDAPMRNVIMFCSPCGGAPRLSEIQDEKEIQNWAETNREAICFMLEIPD